MSIVKFNNRARHTAPYLNNFLDTMFSDAFINSSALGNKMPSVNISESEKAFHVELAAPGLKKEDFQIELKNDVLSIAVEQQKENQEEGRNFSRKEFEFASFKRAFTLPESADAAEISASYKDGILALDIQKKDDAALKAKSILVS